jgi:DNA-binding MarR family transcriptional regulator
MMMGPRLHSNAWPDRPNESDEGLALTWILDELSRTYELFDSLSLTVGTALDRQGIDDINPFQLLILSILNRRSLQPSQISALIFNRNKLISHPLKQLHERGYVEQLPHEMDGRAKLIHISAKGRDVLKQLGL